MHGCKWSNNDYNDLLCPGIHFKSDRISPRSSKIRAVRNIESRIPRRRFCQPATYKSLLGVMQLRQQACTALSAHSGSAVLSSASSLGPVATAEDSAPRTDDWDAAAIEWDELQVHLFIRPMLCAQVFFCNEFCRHETEPTEPSPSLQMVAHAATNAVTPIRRGRGRPPLLPLRRSAAGTTICVVPGCPFLPRHTSASDRTPHRSRLCDAHFASDSVQLSPGDLSRRWCQARGVDSIRRPLAPHPACLPAFVRALGRAGLVVVVVPNRGPLASLPALTLWPISLQSPFTEMQPVPRFA